MYTIIRTLRCGGCGQGLTDSSICFGGFFYYVNLLIVMVRRKIFKIVVLLPAFFDIRLKYCDHRIEVVICFFIHKIFGIDFRIEFKNSNIFLSIA